MLKIASLRINSAEVKFAKENIDEELCKTPKSSGNTTLISSGNCDWRDNSDGVGGNNWDRWDTSDWTDGDSCDWVIISSTSGICGVCGTRVWELVDFPEIDFVSSDFSATIMFFKVNLF